MKRSAARAFLILAPLVAPFVAAVATFAPDLTMVPEPARNERFAGPAGEARVTYTPQNGGFLGILTRPSSAEITGVLPASPAASAGLRAGDVVRDVDGEPVAGPDDLRRLLQGRPPGGRIVLGIARGARDLRAQVTLSTRPNGAP